MLLAATAIDPRVENMGDVATVPGESKDLFILYHLSDQAPNFTADYSSIAFRQFMNDTMAHKTHVAHKTFLMSCFEKKIVVVNYFL